MTVGAAFNLQRKSGKMHAPYDPPAGIENLSFSAILQLDAALRRARQKVFSLNPLTDTLWTLLSELAASQDGMAFEGLESGPGKAMGRPMLLAGLAGLQEQGLVSGHKDAASPMLSHLRVTPQGFARLDEVVGTALVIARRK